MFVKSCRFRAFGSACRPDLGSKGGQIPELFVGVKAEQLATKNAWKQSFTSLWFMRLGSSTVYCSRAMSGCFLLAQLLMPDHMSWNMTLVHACCQVVGHSGMKPEEFTSISRTVTQQVEEGQHVSVRH